MSKSRDIRRLGGGDEAIRYNTLRKPTNDNEALYLELEKTNQAQCHRKRIQQFLFYNDCFIAYNHRMRR